MAIINVIQWNGPPSVLAWRNGNASIMSGSQLIVKEHQQAVLMKEGRMIGPFLPGRHTLTTKNYPILKQLIGTAIDAETPFPAEVWFVNRSIDLNVKWGTSTPIQVRDPTYGIMLPVLGYGMVGVSVADTKKFLLKLVGSMDSYDRDTVEHHFRAILITSIKSHIARSLQQRSLSILDIAAHLSELSDDLEGMFREEFAEFGLAIVAFRIESITTREDNPAVERLRDALAKKAEYQILGTNFAQSESFDVMKRAASNEGGAVGPFVGAGLGLGLGAAVGSQGAQLASVVQPAASACASCTSVVPQGARFCPSCGVAPNSNNVTCCQACRLPLPHGAQFCSQCGKPSSLKCARCGVTMSHGSRFCSSCGTKADS